MNVVKIGLPTTAAAVLLVFGAGSFFGRHDGPAVPAAEPDATVATAVFAVG